MPNLNVENYCQQLQPTLLANYVQQTAEIGVK
jgi:hypothetical protein